MIMTITRALTEVKLLDSRIETKIQGGQFIASVKKSSAKVNNMFTREEFEKYVNSTYDSIKDLMERRRIIKSSIVKSNAITLVKIGDKEYTVADAIERRKNIEVERELVEVLERQYKNAVANANANNEKVDRNLDNLLNSSLSADTNKKGESVIGFAEAYRNDNYYEVIDVLNLKSEIEKIKTDIMKFDGEFDICLTESNSITTIEIPD